MSMGKRKVTSIIDRYKAGTSVTEIAKLENVTYNTVKAKIKKYEEEQELQKLKVITNLVEIEKLKPIIEEFAHGTKLQKIVGWIVSEITPEYVQDLMRNGGIREGIALLNTIGNLSIKGYDVLNKVNSNIDETYTPETDNIGILVRDTINSIEMKNPEEFIEADSNDN